MKLLVGEGKERPDRLHPSTESSSRRAFGGAEEEVEESRPHILEAFGRDLAGLPRFATKAVEGYETRSARVVSQGVSCGLGDGAYGIFGGAKEGSLGGDGLVPKEYVGGGAPDGGVGVSECRDLPNLEARLLESELHREDGFAMERVPRVGSDWLDQVRVFAAHQQEGVPAKNGIPVLPMGSGANAWKKPGVPQYCTRLLAPNFRLRCILQHSQERNDHPRVSELNERIEDRVIRLTRPDDASDQPGGPGAVLKIANVCVGYEVHCRDPTLLPGR
jgi:hypothetical protein